MQPQYSKEVIIFFIAANIIVAGFAIFIFFILRVQQKRKQLYQKQLLEQEYKTREESFLQISRDLHDDIGSSLSGINMLSQLAQQQLANSDYGTTGELLQKISVYTNEVLEKVSDMAWLLKPNQESLSVLIKKLKAYSLTAASLKNIFLQFDNDLEISKTELTIQQRKAVYLISKESINNAIKYSCCNNIFYRISTADKRIKLIIKDDGNGFDASEISNGYGLTNMKSRATDICATFGIESAPGKGTIVTLEF